MERTYSSMDHPFSLVDRLTCLWKEAQLCDATIGVGPASFMFHKLVYAATIPDYMKLSECSGKVHFQFGSDVSLAAVESILTYLYTGCLKLSTNHLESVEKIADKMLLRKKISAFIDNFKQETAVCRTDSGGANVSVNTGGDTSASGSDIVAGDDSSVGAGEMVTVKSEPFSEGYSDFNDSVQDADGFANGSMEVVSSSTSGLRGNNRSSLTMPVPTARGRGSRGGWGLAVRIGGRGGVVRGRGRGRGMALPVVTGIRGRGTGMATSISGRGQRRGIGSRGGRGSRGGGRGKSTADQGMQISLFRDGRRRGRSGGKGRYVPNSLLSEEQIERRRESQRKYYMKYKSAWSKGRVGRIPGIGITKPPTTVATTTSTTEETMAHLQAAHQQAISADLRLQDMMNASEKEQAAFTTLSIESAGMKRKANIFQMGDNDGVALPARARRGRRKGGSYSSVTASSDGANLDDISLTDSTDSQSLVDTPVKQARESSNRSLSPATSKNLIVKLGVANLEPKVVLDKCTLFSSSQVVKSESTVNDTTSHCTDNLNDSTEVHRSGIQKAYRARRRGRGGRRILLNERRRSNSNYIPVQYLTDEERRERNKKIRDYRHRKITTLYVNESGTVDNTLQYTSTSDWLDSSVGEANGDNALSDDQETPATETTLATDITPGSDITSATDITPATDTIVAGTSGAEVGEDQTTGTGDVVPQMAWGFSYSLPGNGKKCKQKSLEEVRLYNRLKKQRYRDRKRAIDRVAFNRKEGELKKQRYVPRALLPEDQLIKIREQNNFYHKVSRARRKQQILVEQEAQSLVCESQEYQVNLDGNDTMYMDTVVEHNAVIDGDGMCVATTQGKDVNLDGNDTMYMDAGIEQNVVIDGDGTCVATTHVEDVEHNTCTVTGSDNTQYHIAHK